MYIYLHMSSLLEKINLDKNLGLPISKNNTESNITNG